MLICNFPKIANLLLKDLPKNDYPVLNTFLFVSCWLGLIMDQSLTGMTDLITRLNNRDIKVHLSTFSKASLNRSDEIFQKILHKAMIELQKKKGKSKNKILFPLDSTIITLTSKLLWKRGYHQVKLFCGLNDWTSGVAGILINFGQGNDSKYGNHTIDSIPENGIGIMDRGFCSKIRISELLQKENQFFVLRIKNNITLKFLENNKFLIGTTKQVETRLINFCDLDNKTEYRLVTNLKESEINDDEIREIYRKRWAIETLWKFLKMHLKLDKLITRNENGIRIQIYSCLIVYILLQLIDIPEEIGKKSLDKLRYLQSFMSENISYIHWFKRMSYSW
jgi:IS4 transposase